MPQPSTLEEALQHIDQLKNAIQLKSRSITWLENKLVATENALFFSKQSRETLLKSVEDLSVRLAQFESHADTLTERLFMCENEPSLS